MSGSYARLYRRAREAIEEDAEMRLQRSLTAHERNVFRNCGTLTALEALGMKVYMAETPEELAAHLAGLSMESRFGLALDELMQRLTRVLGRPVSDQERQLLRKAGNIEALWDLEQQVHDAMATEREQVLRRLLQG